MRILGLIPARGGSKRLPRKNVMPLGALPLIAWTIRAVQASGTCCDLVVSTDDTEIADTARAFGASVPGLRPAALATDTATSVDVALHALAIYEAQHGQVDLLMLLQPTSPFRTAATIRAAVDLFAQGGGQPVIGVSPAASHPAWCFRIDDNALVPYVDNGALASRSQDLPPAYAVNGAMYLVAPAILRDTRSLFGERPLPLIMDSPIESLDIDTSWDWKIAESLVRTGAVEPPER